MNRVEVILPAMGEGIIEAAITKWLVTNGQFVKADQPIVEVATDKVDTEIPAPVDGKIVRLVYHEGEIPKVGEVIALIETEQPVLDGAPGKDTAVLPASSDKLVHHRSPAHEKPRLWTSEMQQSNRFISPLVRLLAKQRGLSADELNSIQASGLNGRITKDDVNSYILSGRPGAPSHNHGSAVSGHAGINSQSDPDPVADPGDEVIELGRLRKLIADNMMRSMRVAAHVTSFLEADITNLVAWREANKEEFLNREGARLTFTPIVIKAVSQALKDFPRINVSISGDSLIIRRNINIGFATALPDGNLIVPVIRNADHESLGSLARKISDMAGRARENALLPAEIKGSTFTVTNIGQYNNLTGTPIINQPESAILAVGTILKKPWAVKAAGDWGIAVRDITMLSLTYDHRVIDGALGGSFLSRVAWYLENFVP